MKTPSQYGVLDLLQDIRDAHSICTGDAISKAILFAIASRTTRKSNFTCFPSLETISGDTQISERTIRGRMDRMVKSGLIERKRRYDNSYIYSINVKKIKAAAGTQRAIWEAEKDQGKNASSDDDSEFDRMVAENRQIAATPSTEADDASFPPSTSSGGISYVGAISGWLLASRIAEVMDGDAIHALAVGICGEFPGSVPAFAAAKLTDTTINRIVSKDNPGGYLRNTLRKMVEYLQKTPYERDHGSIADFIPKLSGTSFWVGLERHPIWVDDLIESMLSSGNSIGSPQIATNEGEIVLFIPSGDEEFDFNNEFEAA